MSGLRLTIPASFTDTTLPILRDDPILFTGSLALHEPASLANPIAAGLPAQGGAVPNIAWKEAGAALGSTYTSASAPALFSYGGAVGPAGAKGIIERTPKGGIHAIISQAQALAAGDHATLTLDTAIRTYLAANTAHRYYLSLWGQQTRLDPTPGASTYAEMASIGMGGSVSTRIAALMDNGQAFGQAASGQLAATPIVAGNFLAAIGNVDIAGTPAANGRVTWGTLTSSLNAAALGTRNGHWPSWILYRVYLEDLTVSGRTYAAVKAIDDAQYATAFGTGGRYVGDTFTNPTTLP